MTNGVAVTLALMIAAALGLDFFLNDLQASLFLTRKIFDLIEWLAFWR